ncbi:GNAT family N-acetyltransferase [Paenibacillus sp. SC116]|uniref:GNAT family N-acetyltransferase n=1 Tax=Paenibacillus sp. SC116 TaxID=2968986 RepID=UPI00215AB4CB|nr:GNAT family N-acetyltransferase [Paenibacillus sp. SC116]MCR8846131.1 GNAT family N-acetyltransferase [Paenibacillus sp. SC116]
MELIKDIDRNRRIEQYALNAWPALQTNVLDGWLLRFADGYTKRSNSVSAIYNQSEVQSYEQLLEKIHICERLYEGMGLDVIFKMTPFVPSSLDALLADEGYQYVEPSSVQVLESLYDLNGLTAYGEQAEQLGIELEACEYISQKWLDIVADFNHLSTHNRQITRQLLSNSLLRKGFFILYVQSVPVACGLGVIEGEYIGLYDIVTAEPYRNQGYGEQLIRGILNWALSVGVKKSYILVVQGNHSAKRLYEKLGYKEIYTYWYRVKANSNKA